MPTYFTLAELIKSDTATKKGIDNSPSWAVVEHLRTLVEEFLDPLRAAWGKPIRVYHSIDDDSVPYIYSLIMTRQAQRVGADA